MITPHTRDTLIAFEAKIRDHWQAGSVATQVHLCGGNEEQLIEIFRDVKEGDWIFSTHRAHYHALLAGVAPERVESLILNGKSMFIFDRSRNFVSTAILAGQCCIAAGVAWDIKRTEAEDIDGDPSEDLDARPPHVWCFLGDGAEEEGHFYEAALWVESHELPCTFIIEDNGWQMDTPKAERRSGAAGQPLDHFRCVKRYRYERTYPHAGTGQPIKPITAEAIERCRPQ